jgi:hypothetical protein
MKTPKINRNKKRKRREITYNIRDLYYRRVAVILWVMGDDPSVAFRRCAWGTGRLLLLGVLLRERLEMDILLFYILHSTAWNRYLYILGERGRA